MLDDRAALPVIPGRGLASHKRRQELKRGFDDRFAFPGLLNSAQKTKMGATNQLTYHMISMQTTCDKKRLWSHVPRLYLKLLLSCEGFPDIEIAGRDWKTVI